MTTTTQTKAHTYEMRRAAALHIAVVALEQANAAEGDDPISAHQFRSILEQARRTVARLNVLIGDLERGEDGQGNG